MSEGLLGAIAIGHHLAGPYRLALISSPADVAAQANEDYWLWFYIPLAVVYVVLGMAAAFVGVYVASEIGLGQYQLGVWAVEVLAKLVQAWAIVTAACPIVILAKVAWGIGR